MRVFIAIELPENIKEGLEKLVISLKRSISNVKWVEKENFHITLRFIGEVDKDKVLQIEKILDEVGSRFSPFEAELSGLGKFPHVLWVGIDENVYEIKMHKDKQDEMAGIYRIACENYQDDEDIIGDDMMAKDEKLQELREIRRALDKIYEVLTKPKGSG